MKKSTKLPRVSLGRHPRQGKELLLQCLRPGTIHQQSCTTAMSGRSRGGCGKAERVIGATIQVGGKVFKPRVAAKGRKEVSTKVVARGGKVQKGVARAPRGSKVQREEKIRREKGAKAAKAAGGARTGRSRR